MIDLLKCRYLNTHLDCVLKLMAAALAVLSISSVVAYSRLGLVSDSVSRPYFNGLETV